MHENIFVCARCGNDDAAQQKNKGTKRAMNVCETCYEEEGLE